MTFDKNTKLRDVMKKYPWLVEDAVKLDARFKQLNTTPGKLWLKTADIAALAKKAGVSVDEVIAQIKEIIAKH